jgi:hypothetical protein
MIKAIKGRENPVGREELLTSSLTMPMMRTESTRESKDVIRAC